MLTNDVIAAYAAAKLNPEDRASACRVQRLLKFFDGVDVRELRTQDLKDAYIEERNAERVGKTGKPLSKGALRRELGVVMAAFNWADFNRFGGVTRDDVPRWELPKDTAVREHWVTREDAKLLLQHAQPAGQTRLTREFLAVSLLLFTAARKQAASELTWDRVHFMPTAAGNGYIDLRDPAKVVTRKRRAVVPIFDEFAPIVARAQREATTPYFLFHPGDCAFNVRKAFTRANLRDKYDVTKKDYCHLLRKTCATWAAQDDVPMGQIADMLGDTIQTTERHYAIHSPSYMQKIAKRSVLGALLP